MIGGISGVSPYTYGLSHYSAAQFQNQNVQNAQNTQSQRAQNTGGTAAWGVRRSSALETPVQPVTPARAVSPDEASIPALMSRMENDPAAMAGRMRLQYGQVNEEGLFVETGKDAVEGPKLAALEGELSRAEAALAKGWDQETPVEKESPMPNAPEAAGTEKAKAVGGEDGEGSEKVKSAQETMEEGECQTCKERKYQDGSDDPGVSFKTPTNIAPEQAASAVRGHEMEHVYREQAKAEREDRKVVSQTVTMHTEICPECGEAYVSGGTTRTVTKANTDNEAQQDAAQREKERTPFSAVA